MIKGIISLFTTGMILNPMILLGIASGMFLSYRFDSNIEKLIDIFSGYDTYLVAVSIAFVYTFAFNQVYKGYSSTVDWDETFKRFIGNSLKIVLSTIMSVIFFATLIF